MWLLLQPIDELEEEDHVYVEHLLEGCPVVQKAATLALALLGLVRQREAEALEPWLRQARASAIPELERFAARLERDGAAVRAALMSPYSNGWVDGQVNKLKLVNGASVAGGESFRPQRRPSHTGAAGFSPAASGPVQIDLPRCAARFSHSRRL